MDDDSAQGPQDQGQSLRDLLTLGGMLVGSIVTGLVLGLLLDAWFGTSPAFVLAGTALGIVAAGAGFWLRVRDFLRG
jgi:F0F1-type ATP synthase assembly protein I